MNEYNPVQAERRGWGAVVHTVAPVYNSASRVLILGTMPSPQSRKLGFYYMHPQNRFWKVLALVLNQSVPDTPLERREFLLEHHIALWDVLSTCEISGADDASIRNPVPNDLTPIFQTARIQAVFTTGKKAYELYQRYCAAPGWPDARYLPSTSPANGRFSLTSLADHYREILPFLDFPRNGPSS